jgi:hypothetical protein
VTNQFKHLRLVDSHWLLKSTLDKHMQWLAVAETGHHHYHKLYLAFITAFPEGPAKTWDNGR